MAVYVPHPTVYLSFAEWQPTPHVKVLNMMPPVASVRVTDDVAISADTPQALRTLASAFTEAAVQLDAALDAAALTVGAS